METLQLVIQRLIDGRKEAEVVASMTLEPTSPEDWQLPPGDLKRKTAEHWNAVQISNGESIDICISISTVNDGFSISIKQNDSLLFQLVCMGKPSFVFRTLSGELLAGQAFDYEEHIQSTQ